MKVYPSSSSKALEVSELQKSMRRFHSTRVGHVAVRIPPFELQRGNGVKHDNLKPKWTASTSHGEKREKRNQPPSHQATAGSGAGCGPLTVSSGSPAKASSSASCSCSVSPPARTKGGSTPQEQLEHGRHSLRYWSGVCRK